jgi:hypothetical protein
MLLESLSAMGILYGRDNSSNEPKRWWWPMQERDSGG